MVILPAAGGPMAASSAAGVCPAPTGLQARPPRGADKLLTAPGRPRRSLKNLFQEHGIEVGLRQRLPAVWLGDRLLHVPGLGTDPASPWTFHFLPDL